MLGYLSADIIVPRNTVFRERRGSCELCRTENVRGKTPGIFSHHMEAIMFIILQIFSQHAGSFENWKIPLGCSPVLAGHIQSRDEFRPIAYEQIYFIDFKDNFNY